MLTSRAARAALLDLPPPLRVAAYQHTRPFSASAPRKFTSLVDLAAALPSTLLTTLHSTGLPWYAVLPTTACLIRGLLIYHTTTLPARRAARIQANLNPLASARVLHKLNAELPADKVTLGPLVIPVPMHQRKFVRFCRAHYWQNYELHNLGKQFGAPKFRARNLLNFGVLIAFTEAIRMKCGSREGLLPLLLWPFQWVNGAVEGVLRAMFPEAYPPAAAVPEAPPQARLDEEALRAATTVDAEGMTSIDMSRLQVAEPTTTTQVYTAHFDPTLKDEGLSWCLDLTAPDPTLILPTALALTMAANTIFRPTVGGPPKTAPPTSPSTTPAATPGEEPFTQPPNIPPPGQSPLTKYLPPLTNLQRIGLSFTIVIWFAILKMPAAVLLYLVPSLVVGSLQRRWLDLRVPVREPVRGCRRPLRYRVKRGLGD